MLAAVPGMNGSIMSAIWRSPSRLLYSTRSRSALLASSFASAHGAETSTYLLTAWMNSQTSARASLKARRSRLAVEEATVAAAFSASVVSSWPGGPASGATLPRYLPDMVSTLLSRLPRSFASSAL